MTLSVNALGVVAHAHWLETQPYPSLVVSLMGKSSLTITQLQALNREEQNSTAYRNDSLSMSFTARHVNSGLRTSGTAVGSTDSAWSLATSAAASVAIADFLQDLEDEFRNEGLLGRAYFHFPLVCCGRSHIVGYVLADDDTRMQRKINLRALAAGVAIPPPTYERVEWNW